jgi:uncharacterized damage-inducible protein DinB
MRKTFACLVTLCFAAVSIAQDAPKPPYQKGEYLKHLQSMQKKFTSLAEKIPAEKYTWRPAPGVRSISEVLVHIAGANILMLNAVGVKPPADLKLSREMEKTMTDKAEIVALLKKSYDHTVEAAQALNPTELEKATTLFRSPSTYGGVYLTSIGHQHEHLGQLIAYARVNGITPPWSGE